MSAASSASWANSNQPRRGQLLYAPLMLVNQDGGTQAVWNPESNVSASLPASARAGWSRQASTPGPSFQGPSRAYSTMRVPSQLSGGYVEKGSADSLVESVNTRQTTHCVNAWNGATGWVVLTAKLTY